MRSITTLCICTALLVQATAAVAHDGRRGQGTSVYADVVSVEPLVRVESVPVSRRECWDEPVRYRGRHRDSTTSAILGGIVGGLVGHEIGDRRNRDLTTFAGAVLGASIGHDLGDSRHRDRVAYERQCRVVQVYEERRRTDSYRVTYVYGGRRYVTELPYDPGRRLRVSVAVTPRY